MSTSVPVHMALPTSAEASAGVSLTPSPLMATTLPQAFWRSTTAAFRLGRTSASTLSIPSYRATASAVVRLSPVSMTTRMLSSLRPAKTLAVVALIRSAMAITPATRPLMAA